MANSSTILFPQEKWTNRIRKQPNYVFNKFISPVIRLLQCWFVKQKKFKSIGNMKHARCLHEAFAHRARWENLAGARRQYQFVLRMALGPVDDKLHYMKGHARVVLRGAIEADLILDTGSTMTIISGDIAHQLDLPFHGKPVEVELAGGGTRLFARATVCVAIGTNWQTIPCLVPWPIDTGKCTKNLLGMRGLLDHHIFCLACDELHLFRRQSHDSVEAVS